jgi:4-aminobutyrate aminotransferase
MQPLNLPGPKAQALIARDNAVISPSYPRGYPFVMDHGRGTEVWDVDGNRFLDFEAGIAVASTGHSHPRWSKPFRIKLKSLSIFPPIFTTKNGSP